MEKSTSERKHHIHHSRSSTVHLSNPAPLRSPGCPEHDEQHDRPTRHAPGRHGHRRSSTEDRIHQKKKLPFRSTATAYLSGVCFDIDENNPDIRWNTRFQTNPPDRLSRVHNTSLRNRHFHGTAL